ncbi:MAG TPA: DUF4175 family protein [Planctomycetota bacterium]|nr:DUF4175 family protein [Planctomycetota bacterium]
MANQYSDLQAHLHRVRWAWKRAAAARGAAIVVMEVLGMVAVFATLDHLYALPQTARYVILGTMALAVLVLSAVHVISPLLRRISDEQIALFIEERNGDGALISATAFGKDASEGRKDVYGFIIGNIVESAVRRASAIRLNQVLNLAQLRKYAIAAGVLLLIFGVSALRFRSVQSSTSRLLLPWNAPEEETTVLAPGEVPLSFNITLDPGPRVPRSGQLVLRATLNREPSNPVQLKYRSKGAPEFRALKMSEIEELYAFSVRLPDINDDMEFFVQCGADESQLLQVGVYDPLLIKNYEVVITPPAYTKQVATSMIGESADITALAGSTVRVRALTNTPIKSGELVVNGASVALQPFNDDTGQGAGAEFPVQADGSYKLTLANIYEPDLPAAAEFTIKALKDEAPSISLIEPGAEISVHPSAEIEFRGRANDDVGLASVEMIYSTSDSPDTKVRAAMTLPDHGPGEHEAGLLLAPSELPVPLKPGGTIFYHLEARDLAGHVAISDIFMVKVRPYEIAGAYPDGKTHYSHAPAMDLMQFVAAAWNLHSQKPTLEKVAYDQQCEALAEKMVQPDGSLKRFKKPKLKHMTAEQKAQIEAGEKCVLKAVDSLRAHDAEQAVAEMRRAIGLWEALNVGTTYNQDTQAMRVGDTPDNHSDGVQEHMGFTRLDAPSYTNTAPQIEVTLPEYRRRIKPDEAKALLKETRTLQTNQERLIAELKMLAATQKDEQPEMNDAENQEQEEEAPEQQASAQSNQEENNSPEFEDPLASKSKKRKPGAAQPNKNSSDRKKSPQGAQGGGQQSADNKDSDKEEQKDQEQNRSSDQLASRAERKNELIKKQEALAREAADLAKRTASLNAGDNKDAKEVADALRQSSQQMNSSLQQIQKGNMQQALARSEEARRQLKNAYDTLDRSQFESLDRALEATDRRASDIVSQQKKIQEGLNKVLADARARPENSSGSTAEAQPKLNAQDLAKLKGLTDLQVENQRLVDDLEKFAGELEKWAASAQKPDAADKIKRAVKLMQQENLSGKMVNAAVSMRSQEASDAEEEMKQVEKTLGNAASLLSAASQSMAQTKEQKLKRAVRDAEDIVRRAEELADSPGSAGPQEANGKKHDKQRETNSAHNDERKKAQSELYRDTVRWAKRVEQDRLADAGAINSLGGSLKSEEDFEAMFKEADRTKLDRYMVAVRSTSASLEDKLKDVIKQKRLSAAQREQTPPQYRAMVNAYYEALARDDN